MTGWDGNFCGSTQSQRDRYVSPGRREVQKSPNAGRPPQQEATSSYDVVLFVVGLLAFWPATRRQRLVGLLARPTSPVTQLSSSASLPTCSFFTYALSQRTSSVLDNTSAYNTMKTFVAVAGAMLASSSATAFQQPVSSQHISRGSSTALFEYIPSGFTKESWAKFKAKEQAKKDELAKKNLGRLGPKGFQSRSFQSFQEALERGEATHLMPVLNAEERIRKGELKREDIPYMQRGGNWDNSDIKGAKKVRWLNSDKEYASGGFLKEQSVSIFGYGKGLDWTGTRDKEGPAVSPVKPGKFTKNYQAPNVANIKSQTEKPAPKKMFGLF